MSHEPKRGPCGECGRGEALFVPTEHTITDVYGNVSGTRTTYKCTACGHEVD